MPPPASKGYAADLLDRYTSAAGVGVTYDANGNLTGGDGTGHAYGAVRLTPPS
jgi:hypothetical protein